MGYLLFIVLTYGWLGIVIGAIGGALTTWGAVAFTNWRKRKR